MENMKFEEQLELDIVFKDIMENSLLRVAERRVMVELSQQNFESKVREKDDEIAKLKEELRVANKTIQELRDLLAKGGQQRRSSP